MGKLSELKVSGFQVEGGMVESQEEEMELPINTG
jgi:hypothetical protein